MFASFWLFWRLISEWFEVQPHFSLILLLANSPQATAAESLGHMRRRVHVIYIYMYIYIKMHAEMHELAMPIANINKYCFK